MGRNPHYDEDRDLILATLTPRGWTLTSDGKLTETADLEYPGKVFTFRVSHFSVSDQRAFNLIITHTDGRELVYMVEYGDRLPDVLAALLSMQDVADEKNITRHLARLHDASEEMYVYEGDEPVPLSDVHVGGAVASRIAQALAAAGWKFSDDSTPEKPDLFYKNRTVALEIIQAEAEPKEAPDFAVYLIVGRQLSNGLSLIVYYENQLDALLRHLVKWQDDVSPTTFQDFLRGVVALCPNTFVIVDDEPQKLVESVPLASLHVP
jgi:hypothetical protein